MASPEVSVGKVRRIDPETGIDDTVVNWTVCIAVIGAIKTSAPAPEFDDKVFAVKTEVRADD